MTPFAPSIADVGTAGRKGVADVGHMLHPEHRVTTVNCAGVAVVYRNRIGTHASAALAGVGLGARVIVRASRAVGSCGVGTSTGAGVASPNYMAGVLRDTGHRRARLAGSGQALVCYLRDPLICQMKFDV